MKRGLLLLAALALFGCSVPGSEDGGQELESAAPTEEVAPTPTEVAATPTEAPVASALPPVQAADVSNPLLVAQGEIIYQEHCASCHGVNLEGQPDWRRRSDDGTLPAPPHDASGHTWHHADTLLFEITKLGTTAVVGGGYKSTMLGFGEQLDDGEIWAVLSYIKSQWSPRIQAAQPGQ